MNAEEAYEVSRELMQILEKRNVSLACAEVIVCTFYGEILYNIKMIAPFSNEKIIEIATKGLLDCFKLMDEQERERKNGPS